MQRPVTNIPKLLTCFFFCNIGHLGVEPIVELSMVDTDFTQKVSESLYKRIILHTGFIYSFYIQSSTR
jgi:hypothetical protein